MNEELKIILEFLASVVWPNKKRAQKEVVWGRVGCGDEDFKVEHAECDTSVWPPSGNVQKGAVVIGLRRALGCLGYLGKYFRKSSDYE